jgi:hypothetical protein
LAVSIWQLPLVNEKTMVMAAIELTGLHTEISLLINNEINEMKKIERLKY